MVVWVIDGDLTWGTFEASEGSRITLRSRRHKIFKLVGHETKDGRSDNPERTTIRKD